MTVCVAAIANYLAVPTVVAAIDKMITVGDTGFEMQAGSKHLPLTANIVALIAGDASDEEQVWRLARQRIADRGITGVGDAAECFAEAYRELRAVAFERELLSTSTLTWDVFNERRADFDREFVAQVDRLVSENYLPISSRPFGGRTIIAGVDAQSGNRPEFPNWITAHLYVVNDPGQVICHDSAGFVAIGSGARHAESYLMLDRYSKDRDFNHATLNVYSAKRRAESNPNVGPATELIRIDSTGLGYAVADELKEFARIYQQNLSRQNAAALRAKVQMAGFMEARNAQTRQQAANTETPIDTGHPTDNAAGV